ncbi:M28 family peptidase [Thermophilibacter provencensis]|uniref:M28 family peptidase n=1 Tax=Thermophilibacter provencensis TaxID=1852386 RepID=A0ABT7V2J8_9ACTN|nr:M28 family peptidase [Thermophilibacter provencensis]MDM8270828.1 M28 family peptidase [Thermophilibacter provencensis]
MAMTHDYLDYLNEKVDISPANSQEELQAAEVISHLMGQHDVEPQVEEFSAPTLAPLFPTILAIVMFIGVLVSGFGVIALTLVGFVLAIIPTVLSVMRLFGREFSPSFGPTAQSQNVVAVHRAAGPLVTRGSRTIVLVAHYDTPRENFLLTTPLAPYLTLINKLTVPCAYVVALCAFVQVLGFIPSVARIVFWIVGILACVPALIVAAGAISERVGSCTLGANDNKSSVAALLGVLENVRPSGLVPRERPVKPEVAPEREAAEKAEPTDEPAERTVVEPVLGVRRGEEVMRSLGILPEDCEIEYVAPRVVTVPATPAPAAAPMEIDEPEIEAAAEVEAEPEVEATLETAPVAAAEPEPAQDEPAGSTSPIRVVQDEAPAESDAETTKDALLSTGRFSIVMDDGSHGVGPKDTSGLSNIDDVLDPDSTIPAARPARPEAPSDPEWGKSSYRPSLSSVARRATLFDLPDPSQSEADPFATDPNAKRVQPAPDKTAPAAPVSAPAAEAKDDAPVAAPEPISTIGSERAERKAKKNPFSGLLDRLKKQVSAAGEADAGDDDSSDDESGLWRGGAAPRAGLRLVGEDEASGDAPSEVPSEEELREAVLSIGDDALIAHDIWFVALGGSSLDHAGMRAFLRQHRSEIRGCFVVNLDCIGAGQLTLLKNEGLESNRRADRRVSRLLMGAAADLHVELDQKPLDWASTDATPAMRSSLRSVTIRGVDENGLPALSHTSEDVPENVSGDQATHVTEIVTEMIRRS